MKNEYLDKLTKRAKQRAMLLISRPDFQEDILVIRSEFKIPSTGFKDQETNETWHRDFFQGDDRYFEVMWPKERKKVIQLRGEGKYKEAEELQEQFNDEAPINTFRVTIKNLLKKYKLPLRWEESVKRYILFNDIDLMRFPQGITVKEEFDNDTGLKKIWIGIEDDTRKEDVSKFWPIIKFHQKLLHSYVKKKFQPIKRFERDKEAFDLKASGKTYVEIAKILSKKHNKDYGYENIGSFIKRHKQKTGIN